MPDNDWNTLDKDGQAGCKILFIPCRIQYFLGHRADYQHNISSDFENFHNLTGHFFLPVSKFEKNKGAGLFISGSNTLLYTI